MLVTKKHIPPSFTLHLNSTKIDRVSSFKALGIIIDEKLTFKDHILNVCNKLSSCAFATHNLRSLVPRRVLLSLYYGLAYPHLQYCVSIWGGTHRHLTNLLLLAQKRIMRNINKTEYLAHSNPLFVENKLLKFQDIFKLSIVSNVYRMKFRLSPSILSYFIDKNKANHRHETRTASADNFIRKPQYTLTCSQKALSYSGVDIFNSLPESIRDSRSLKCLKKATMAYLISKY